jgi:hypothetical protein
MARRITQKDIENAENMPDIVDADWQEPDEDEEYLERQAKDAEKQILDGLEIDTHNHEYYAYVYKKVNGRKEYCEQVGIELFPLQERLRTKWRGGTFEVIVFKDGKIWKNKTYRIASQPSEDVQRISPATVQDGNMSQIAEMLRQQSELIASLRNEAPRVDPMEEMTRTLQMMQMMKNVFGDNSSNVDPTAMMLKGIELVEKVRGDGESGEENMYSFLKSVFTSPLTQNILQAPRPHPMARPLPMARFTAQDAPPKPDAPDGEGAPPVPAIVAMLPRAAQEQARDQVLYWLDRAKADKDPILYAELAVDTYEEDYIKAVLLHPDVKKVIAYFAPETRYREELAAWFGELLDNIAILTNEPNAPTTNATATDNIENHALATRKSPGNATNVEHSKRSGWREGDVETDETADAAREEKL